MDNFDLDRAIAAWRRGLKSNRVLLGEDLDELDAHLRDHVDELIASGKTAEEAFNASMKRLGSRGLLEHEFYKVRRGRSKRTRSVREDAAWKLALMGNYLRIGARTMRRHAFFAGLNITGLAIGLASTLLILLYLSNELGYDSFHEQGDRTYRLNWDYAWDGREGTGGGTPPPLAENLIREIPGIAQVTRVYPLSDIVVRHDDRFFTEGSILGVDSTFLGVFDFPLVNGNAETALASPGSVVVTESVARKYFGDSDPVGQPLVIGESGSVFGRPYDSSFVVTAVAADPPSQSHIQFDMLTSMSSHPQVEHFDWSWIWMQVVTYAVIDSDADTETVESQITEMVSRAAPAAFNRVGFSYDELIAAGGRWNFRFQPVTDVYLGSATIGNRLGPTGSRSNLQIFGIIAVFVLLIACINAMNLSTARSSRRATEVGVRKALGSARGGLLAQFLMESLLFSALAMLVAVGLVLVLMGPFNQIAGKSLSPALLATPASVGFIIALSLFVGLLAGIYPSFYLSAFRPIEVLKGRVTAGRGGQRLRHGLVVTQFAISIALITCTLLVKGQMSYFGDRDLGFEDQGVMAISNHDHRLGSQSGAFTDALRDLTAVVEASVTTGLPTTFSFGDYYKVEGRGDEQFEMDSYLVDDRFVDALGIQVVAGEAFPPGSPSNARSVILNQVAVSQFGLVDPIGKAITYPGAGDFTVIGVVQDFNFRSLQEPIRPFGLMHESSEAYVVPNSTIAVRVQAGRLPETIAAVRTTWEQFAPDQPFEFEFLDQIMAAQYENERRLQALLLIFASLAIIVACLGLLGLAAFVAERRTKEIGIRKSLGATEASLMGLLVRDFTKWVLLANLVAWPVAWFWVNDWLEDYAYQTEVAPWPFLLAGGAALIIAVATVGYQAVRTARADPVNALRYD